MSETRIALITGANQGVGFQVAKELVANGVTVYLGSRAIWSAVRLRPARSGRARSPFRST